MDDFKRYVFQFNIDNAALNSAADKIETKLSEATRKGMSLSRSGKAEVKQSLADIFGIAEEQAETLRKAMQGIVSMKPEGVTNLKNQLKETLDFVSGIMTKMKGINDSTDWMKQGIGFVDSFKTLQTALENTQDTVSDLKSSVGELKSSFQGFADAFKANDPSAYFKKFGDGVDSVVSKMEGRLKRAKKSVDSFIESGDISPGDFSDYSTEDLNREHERAIQTLSDLEKQMSTVKAGTKEYKSYLIEAADALADLREINKLLSKDSSQGMNTVTADVVATIKQAGEDLKNTIKNLKIDDIKLTVTLPDANATEFNAQVDDFVKQATEKFQGKPIEVSVDLISPFKDAKADALPAEHEKKARTLAEKFINAYNDAISQKDGADKKAKEAIDISGQLSALYDPSVSSVLMKFWDSWNKIYDSVKAGQTTLLEATKTWKQKMTEELKLKFVWFNEDAAEGVSDLFERINQMAEKNPIYLVPAQDYLVKEIEKVLSEHRFSLNVDLGDAQIPISFTGGSGNSGGSGSGGTPPTPPSSQTPPTSNSVPDASRELAETVEEMQEFAYTAESIGEVVERLSNNVNNISARITSLTNEINELDLDKISDDEKIQKRKDDAKQDIEKQKKLLESYELRKKQQEEAYEVAKKEEETVRARLDAEKARRDSESQTLRAQRDTLFADNRTGKHTKRILELNEQIQKLEAPFESSINALEDACNDAHKKLLTIERSIRATGDDIARTNSVIERIKGTEALEGLKSDLAKRNKELTAEKSKQAAFKSILDKGGNPVSLITDRLTTFWESTDETIEKSRDKMQKLAPKLFSMENELKDLQYELDNTDEEQDNEKHSALQERISALQDKITEAEQAIDQKALVKYRNHQRDAGRAITRQNWMRAFGLGDIRDLGTDEALEVVTSVLQHYPAIAASLTSAANGKVNLKGLDIVKQLIDFIPDVQSTLGVVATTNSESNEDLLLKETFVNLFRIADQLNALDGLVDKKTGEVTVEALSGFITAFEKMPQMAMVVQKAKALQKSTDELSEVLGDNEQLKEAFDIGEAKKYLTESFYDLWKAMPEAVRSKLKHNTLDLNKLNSVDKSDGFVKVVYDEFVRAFRAGNLDMLKTDSPEWQSLISLLKQGAIYANHEKATKGLKDSVMGSDGIKRGLYELLHSADPIHVRVVGRDGLEHDYGVQDARKAKMDVEHTYNQTPRSLRRAANKFGITDLLTEKLTIEKGIDAEILQVESELVALDERISKLDEEADKRTIERLSATRETKQRKIDYLRELSKTDDGRRQYEKESARRLREIDEEVFGKVSLSTKKNAPQRKARRNYEYGNDLTIDGFKARLKKEKEQLEKEKERLEHQIAEIDKKDPRTDEDGVPIASKAARTRLQEVESLLAVDNAQKIAIESVRELDKDIETNTAKYQEATSKVNEYTRSLEALADAERKKNVVKDTRDNTFNTISRGLGDSNRTLSNLGVSQQYGTMDKQLVEELEAKIAERSQLMEELDAIPMSQRYKTDKNGQTVYTGKAAELAKKIRELRIEIAQKYSEAEGSYLTNLLAEQLEQIDSNYDRQEADALAQADVKSSDYQTQADAANEQHRQNVEKINSTIDTQKAYYANLIDNAQRESNRITTEWQEKVRQLNAAETSMPQYMIDAQTAPIKSHIDGLQQSEIAPLKSSLGSTNDATERKELEAKIKEIQQKYARMLSEQLKPITDEATRIDREIQAKDAELKNYYYDQTQKDERILVLREERKTATPQRRQEISEEISKIELEYTKKYQEEIAKFKENLVRDFRKQMEEEARKVEEEGRRNAAQVLENAQKEAVSTFNKSESNTGKKVRVYTSIERELEAQRKAALEAEVEAHKKALAQITQVDPKQIEQETKDELARIKAEREEKKQEAIDKFKANGVYKTDETLVAEHITASKEGAEKQAEAQKKSLEQRKQMRQTLMEEYNLTEEMVGTQKKVANADAKRVKVKVKSAQSSAAEANTPPKQESSSPSSGGSSGSSGGSYGGFINTNGLAQESTLRGIWELLNGGAPAGGWGDENKSLSVSDGDFSDGVGKSEQALASSLRLMVDGCKNYSVEVGYLVDRFGQIGDIITGETHSVPRAAYKKAVDEVDKERDILAFLHSHPTKNAKHLSPGDVYASYFRAYTDGRNVPVAGSINDGTITAIDWKSIDKTIADQIINRYYEVVTSWQSTMPEVFTYNEQTKRYDADGDKINADVDLQKTISAKYNEIIKKVLDEFGHLDKYLRFDNSDDFANYLLQVSGQVAENIVETSAQVAVNTSKKSTITQAEIDRYRADHIAKFKTVQGENGKLKYADDKFSNRVEQALLNSKVLNTDDSSFAQADAKKLQTAYDQIKQALAQDASKALGEDVIAFLQKLQGEIAQKLQSNGYGLEKIDTSPSALIKDTIINKDNVNKAKTYLDGLSGDEYKGSGSVETGLKWVNSVLSSTKQKLNQEDILKLGNGYERLMRAVESGLVSKFDEDTQVLINEAIRISKQVLDQYDAEVIGSGSLLGKEITEANKELVKNGAIGKIVSDMTDPAIKIGGKLKQKANASMQKQKKKVSAPQSTEEGKVTEAQREQEKLTRKTAENKEKQANATKKVAEADKQVVSAEKEAFNKQKDAIASLFYTTGENGKKVWSKDKNAQDLTFGLTNASKIFKDKLTDADVQNLNKTGLNLSNILNLDQIDGKVLTDEMKTFIRDLIAKIKAKLDVDTFVETEAKKEESKPKPTQPKAPPAPKQAPAPTPTYSAGVPQPTGGGIGAFGGLPGLLGGNQVWGQLLNVVAKDESVKEIIKALANGIKTTGSGGKQPDDGEEKSTDIGHDAALAAMKEYAQSKYPGAIKTGDVRANTNSYSVDFWRERVTNQEELQKIEENLKKLRADGKANEEEYNKLLQERDKLLQGQEKITVKINKDTGEITSKVGIQNYAVGANAAEKELQKFQGILSQLQASDALNFKEDGSLTSQNQAVYNWIRKMQELQTTRDKLSSEGKLFDAENQSELSQMASTVSKLTKEVLGLLNAESKFDGNIVETFANPEALSQSGELYGKLLSIATATGEVDMATVKYDNTSNTLTYTMKTGKNEVQDMTLHMNALNGAVTQNVIQTKHVDTAWQAFGKSLKGKWQEVARYLTTFGSIYRVWGMLKQGVQYVKEIDTALTELKKVTSETDKTYNKFLQDMAKTGSVVGATVQDLTKSAADWARLGYSLKEAGELAKNTAILMNVSEFEDVNKATDTLISSLQAFKKAGQDVGTFSMEIIDKYNEVGNNYAISTSDLAESLTRSSAALVAANNSLEQSIAMTAAANTTIQDPESVGNALKVVSMRIRGVKSELEEAGEDTENMVTNTAKLQEKIKALTNIDGSGGIDILTNTGEFKSTYDILLAISKVWKDMDDTSQAECCLYVQKCA